MPTGTHFFPSRGTSLGHCDLSVRAVMAPSREPWIRLDFAATHLRQKRHPSRRARYYPRRR